MIEDPAEMAKVRETLQTWLAAFNGKDAETLFSLYDPDSVYANSTAPLMVGLEAIKPWYLKGMETLSSTLRHKEEAAWQSGNLATMLGAYCFEPSPEAPKSDKPAPTGRVFLAFRKIENGDWKLIFDMDNTPTDVDPAWFQ